MTSAFGLRLEAKAFREAAESLVAQAFAKERQARRIERDEAERRDHLLDLRDAREYLGESVEAVSA